MLEAHRMSASGIAARLHEASGDTLSCTKAKAVPFKGCFLATLRNVRVTHDISPLVSNMTPLDFEMPLHHRKLVPEWYDDAGMVHLHPTRQHVAAGHLFKRAPVVSREEVEIIVPRWTLMTGGKVPPAACAAAEMWLRKVAKKDAEVADVVRRRYDG